MYVYMPFFGEGILRGSDVWMRWGRFGRAECKLVLCSYACGASLAMWIGLAASDRFGFVKACFWSRRFSRG